MQAALRRAGVDSRRSSPFCHFHPPPKSISSPFSAPSNLTFYNNFPSRGRPQSAQFSGHINLNSSAQRHIVTPLRPSIRVGPIFASSLNPSNLVLFTQQYVLAYPFLAQVDRVRSQNPARQVTASFIMPPSQDSFDEFDMSPDRKYAMSILRAEHEGLGTQAVLGMQQGIFDQFIAPPIPMAAGNENANRAPERDVYDLPSSPAHSDRDDSPYEILI